MDWEVPF
ncbi:UNVERIFIED_CONTAM: hypothetical protein GTU68_051847 [Idotea baltica]|nr:hypothetical protein [Idotea baltica]